MRPGLRAASIAAVLAAAAWAGCALYGPDLLAPASDGGADAGGTDVGPDTNGAADAGDALGADAGGCVLAQPPPPPGSDDPSDAGDLEVVLAVRAFDLGLRADGGAPPVIGYDLDGLCTCPGPADCVAAAPGGSACDQPGGRDNAGGALLREFYQVSGGSFFSQDALNAQIASGHHTMLLRLRRYNGTPNDTQVELSVYVSDGTLPKQDGGLPSPPAWNGQDAWIVDGRTVFGGAGPPIVPVYFDESAYVAGGVLVGSFGDGVVPLPIDSADLIVIELRAAIVSGTLARTASGWSLTEGVVDGRLAATNLLAELAYVHDLTNQTEYLCPGSPSYANLKGLICPALDVTADPAAPHAQTCDALSMALGFTAQSAQLGVVRTPVRPSTCADGGPDHC
jgi:hypothetical protein